MRKTFNRTFKKGQKIRGIGLIELMLTLAIIIILLFMATRYYMAATSSEKLNSETPEVSILTNKT